MPTKSQIIFMFLKWWSKMIANMLCTFVATLALDSRPRQGVARLRAKRETQEALHMLLGVQKVWGNEPSHYQVDSHVGSWSPEWTPESSERDFTGQNSSPWSVFYIIGRLLKSKKLTVWLLTTKSRELTRFPCVQAMCNLPLESSWRGLQLCLRHHCDQRSAQEVMRPQSHRSPCCCNFGTPTWESRDKKPFGCGPRGEAHSTL